MIGTRSQNSRYTGKKPDIFFNPRNIASIRVTGEGSSQVLLVSGVAFDIAESAENLMLAAELDIAEQHVGYQYTAPKVPAADILAETQETRQLARSKKAGV